MRGTRPDPAFRQTGDIEAPADAHRPVYEIERLSKVYPRNQVRALDDVNLVLGKGEFASVIGSSGCGKSTLLKVMAGAHTAHLPDGSCWSNDR